ncbi:MAG: T9SS type A sorting domain-containing protein [Cyclobacteriaceae bacterium]
MQIQKFTFLVLGFFFLQFTNGQGVSELVYMDQEKLTYVPFAMLGQSNKVNTIPDFSYAGYMGGGVSLPTDIPIKATVNPAPGDDSPRIQAAIDLVSALELDDNGFRGVVLIKAGHYSLETPLSIRESGVILTGEGQGLNGTVLHSNRRTNHDVISLKGSSISIDPESQQQIISSYVPVGSYSFDIIDASAFSVGDKIVVTRTPNQIWIDELGMDKESLCEGKSGCDGWTTSSYTIDHERIITAISGNSISINIPMVDVIEDYFGGGTISKIKSSGRISQCGIENLRIQSFYDGNIDENHAWTAVNLEYTENCWVKEVTGQYLAYSTVNIENSNFNTIQDCAYIDPKSQVSGGRRYSFAIQSGLGNLFQRCYAKSGRHDFVTGSRVTGPNVFLDGLAEDARSDIGPHHRWATGTLFDNIRGASTRVWNRGNSGSGHGWSGAQTMFWNIASYSGEFRVDSPLGSMNWGIGCIGGNQTGAGYWESWGANVHPRSLYLQQLEDRLGRSAVDNVVIYEQKTEHLYDLLAKWGGQGKFSDGGFYGSTPNVRFVNPTGTIDVSTWDGNNIEVDATDSDGTIQHVKLLINGEPIAMDDQAPYIFTELTDKIQNLPYIVHYLQAIATDNDGNTSSTRVTIIGGDSPLVNLVFLEYQEVLVYPNPIQNKELIIRMKEAGSYTGKVYDLFGRKVDQFKFQGINYQCHHSNLHGGAYILEIHDEVKVLSRIKLFIK